MVIAILMAVILQTCKGDLNKNRQDFIFLVTDFFSKTCQYTITCRISMQIIQNRGKKAEIRELSTIINVGWVKIGGTAKQFEVQMVAMTDVCSSKGGV